MSLTQRLEEIAKNDESIFRRQLAKEDLARLLKLEALAANAADLNAFRKEGLYIGWTQGDMRTHDLRDSIEALLDAFYAAHLNHSPEAEQALAAAWDAFHRDRLKKLIHCL
ncbi:MAG: hypothetical protein KDA46_02650 [Parvularculaceae bacterium]|nr:hypothetical protein [Parvularculaceae bacterium]